MKRILLVWAAVTSFSFVAKAQGGLHLGVKVGANLAMVDGQAFKETFDVSYHLGGFVELGLSKKWSIQPEVLWNQTYGRRSNFNMLYSSIANPNGAEKFALDYLSVPILLNYYIGRLITLQAGPQFGILLNEDKSLLLNGQSAFKDGDFSMVGGIQLNVKILRIYGRYNIGLQNINDLSSQDKWTNQQIQFGVGLRF